jgi:hypothetical protein
VERLRDQDDDARQGRLIDAHRAMVA